MPEGNNRMSFALTSGIKALGINSSTIQQRNRAVLLQLIRDNKVISRVDLARLTGLKKATITINVNEFIRVGLVQDGGTVTSETGRKIKGVSLTPNNFFVLCFYMNSRFVEVAVYDITSDCISKVKKEYDHRIESREAYEGMIELVDGLLQTMPTEKIIAIGIGYDGIFSENYLNYDGNPDAFNFKAEVEKKYDKPVWIEQALLYAVHDWRYKNEENLNTQSYIYVYVDNVITSVFQVNRHLLLTGTKGRAGSIGLCRIGEDADGRPVRLDDILSNDGIVETVKQRRERCPDSVLNHMEAITVEDVLGAYHQEDPLALSVFDHACAELGKLLSHYICFANPDKIILGGDLPRHPRILDVLGESSCQGIPEDMRPEIVFDYDASISRQEQIMKGIGEFVTNRCLKHIQIGKE